MQDNISLSSAPGTIRGLHFQKPPHAQGKLIGVLRGAILDVVVDIRQGSPSYGQHVAVEISAERGNQLFVPKASPMGCGRWNPTPWSPTRSRISTMRLPMPASPGNDPDLAIAWPGETPGQISVRDSRLPRLAELGESPFLHEGNR